MNKTIIPKLISSIIELTGGETIKKEIFFTPNIEHIDERFYEVVVECCGVTINTVTIAENVIIDVSRNNECFILDKYVRFSNIEYIDDVKSGDGDDILIGNENDNKIWPGRGNDVVKTGNGKDTIEYTNLNYKNIGNDAILDFDVNFDKIQIKGLGYAYLSSLFVENGYGNAVINGDGWSIELYNVGVGELSESNFIVFG